MKLEILTLTPWPNTSDEERYAHNLFRTLKRDKPYGLNHICMLFRNAWREILRDTYYPMIFTSDTLYDPNMCKKRVFGNSELIVLRGEGALDIPFHSAGELAILRDTSSGKYIVFQGEVKKRNFSWGPIKIYVSKDKPLEDFQEIITDWHASFEKEAIKAGWIPLEKTPDRYENTNAINWNNVKFALGNPLEEVSLEDYRDYLAGTGFPRDDHQSKLNL